MAQNAYDTIRSKRYDWAQANDTANPHKPKGVSEFILKPGTPYTITGRFTTMEYCSRPAQ